MNAIALMGRETFQAMKGFSLYRVMLTPQKVAHIALYVIGASISYGVHRCAVAGREISYIDYFATIAPVLSSALISYLYGSNLLGRVVILICSIGIKYLGTCFFLRSRETFRLESTRNPALEREIELAQRREKFLQKQWDMATLIEVEIHRHRFDNYESMIATCKEHEAYGKTYCLSPLLKKLSDHIFLQKMMPMKKRWNLDDVYRLQKKIGDEDGANRTNSNRNRMLSIRIKEIRKDLLWINSAQVHIKACKLKEALKCTWQVISLRKRLALFIEIIHAALDHGSPMEATSIFRKASEHAFFSRSLFLSFLEGVFDSAQARTILGGDGIKILDEFIKHNQKKVCEELASIVYISMRIRGELNRDTGALEIDKALDSVKTVLEKSDYYVSKRHCDRESVNKVIDQKMIVWLYLIERLTYEGKLQLARQCYQKATSEKGWGLRQHSGEEAFFILSYIQGLMCYRSKEEWEKRVGSYLSVGKRNLESRVELLGHFISYTYNVKRTLIAISKIREQVSEFPWSLRHLLGSYLHDSFFHKKLVKHLTVSRNGDMDKGYRNFYKNNLQGYFKGVWGRDSPIL